MTREEINRKTAELCGWTKIERALPDFYGDLNACAQMEKLIVDAPETIENDGRRVDLACWIQELSVYKPAFHTTAPQRCVKLFYARWENGKKGPKPR